MAGISEAVRNWAAAWARRDTGAYFAAYVPGYMGDATSPATWRDSRRDRIANKKDISVSVSNIVVSINKSQKSATFLQSYTANQLRQLDRKTLEFEQRDGRWLIRRETSIALRP